MPHPDYIVFYGQQVYGEYSRTTVPPSCELPDGCYVRNPKGHWYILIGGGSTPINYSDIPNEVRLNCLLMGISV